MPSGEGAQFSKSSSVPRKNHGGRRSGKWDAIFAIAVTVILVATGFVLALLTTNEGPISIDGKFEDWLEVTDMRKDPFGDVVSSASGSRVSHHYSEDGVYAASLKVTDSAGQESEVRLSVPVPNRSPVAAFTYEIQDLNVSLNASPSRDPEGGPLSYSWDFGDGTSASGLSVNHTHSRRGYYSIRLTVTDEWLAENSTTRVLLVGSLEGVGNSLPSPRFSISVVDYTVIVDASPSNDSDGLITKVVWDFGDGFSYQGNSTTHEYGGPGAYTVSLTVYDDFGASTNRTTVVDIPNHRPLVHMEISAQNLRIYANGSTTNDEDQDEVSYEWSFGDGSTATGYAVTYLYRNSGQYRVELNATDSRGASNSTSALVTVASGATPNQAPVLAVNWTLSGFLLRASAASSYDVDGEIIQFIWDLGDGKLAEGEDISHLYQGPGYYRLSLAAYDDRGAKSVEWFAVDIAPDARQDSPPVPRAKIVIVDYDVVFDGEDSTDDVEIADYVWLFGDDEFGPDIVESKTLISGPVLFFYFSFSREIDNSLCECSWEMFLDLDGLRLSGFAVQQLGAEFSVLISVSKEGATRAILRWYFDGTSAGKPKAWADLYNIPLVFDGREAEGLLRQQDLLWSDLSLTRILLYARDGGDRYDFADVR